MSDNVTIEVELTRENVSFTFNSHRDSDNLFFSLVLKRKPLRFFIKEHFTNQNGRIKL
jgi:hypothetical protein